MRDCLFFVADSNIEFAIRGLFERGGVFNIIGCSPFSFDPKQDLAVARGQNDPGLYARAKDLIQPFHGTHRRIIVIMDEDWDGTPGQAKIEEQLNSHIEAAGWGAGNGKAIVVTPEADNWIWSDSPHTAAALGWESFEQIRNWLNSQGMWPENMSKPPRPKEALEKVLRLKCKPRSSSLYRIVAGKSSVKRCLDPSVELIFSTLRGWFPLKN
ncbi:hypothetical protein UAJ10_00400 [Nitrospirillum sp. BR 11164]|uniref:methylation-associated defense system protein MAD4 n=1 Tax=Nitrospirillum sp. BR 11164 TaxID=3104324 RepID=UPI002AFF20C7|nr:hypothetical protein [Nitrospirillum sp. BR 11164]MEA1647473.1 hypothetical protein [Nitrospirillum sp. BR 11164]